MLRLRNDVPFIDDGFGEERPLREAEARALLKACATLSAEPVGLEELDLVHVERWIAEVNRVREWAAGGAPPGRDLTGAADAWVEEVRRAREAAQVIRGMGAGDLVKAQRWITAHPNGPGTRGIPLLIESTAGGGAKIIGGAGGKLNGQELGKLKPGAGGPAPNTREARAAAEAAAAKAAEARAAEAKAAEAKAAATKAAEAKTKPAAPAGRSKAAKPADAAKTKAAAAAQKPITPKQQERAWGAVETLFWRQNVGGGETYRFMRENPTDPQVIELAVTAIKQKADRIADSNINPDKATSREKDDLAFLRGSEGLIEHIKANGMPELPPNADERRYGGQTAASKARAEAKQQEARQREQRPAEWERALPVSGYPWHGNALPRELNQNPAVEAAAIRYSLAITDRKYARDLQVINNWSNAKFDDHMSEIAARETKASRELSQAAAAVGQSDKMNQWKKTAHETVSQKKPTLNETRAAAKHAAELEALPRQQPMFKSARFLLPIAWAAPLAKSTLAAPTAPGEVVDLDGVKARWRLAMSGAGVLEIPLSTGKALLVLAATLSGAMAAGREELARVLSGLAPRNALIGRPGALTSARK
jgi:hypothetical protein